jgi:hypothetical protein
MSAAKVHLAPSGDDFLADLFVGVQKLALQFGAEIVWNDQQAGGAWEAVLGFRDHQARAAALTANHSDPGGWGFYMHPADHLVEGVHFNLKDRSAPPLPTTRAKKKEKKEAELAGDKRAEGSTPARQAPRPLANGRLQQLRKEIDQIPVLNTFIHFAEQTPTKRSWSAEARKRESSPDAAESGQPRAQVASSKLAPGAASTFETPKRKVEEQPLSALRTPLPSLSPTTKKHAMTQTPTSMLRGAKDLFAPLSAEGNRLAQSNASATGYAFREEQPGRLFPHDFVTPLRQYRASPVPNGLPQVEAVGLQTALLSSASCGESDLDLETPARPVQRRRRGGRGRGLNKQKDKENQHQEQACAAQVQRQRRNSDNM